MRDVPSDPPGPQPVFRPVHQTAALDESKNIVGMQIYDERETELPNVGLMHVKDAETGQTRILDTSSKSVRDKYAEWFADHTEKFRQLFAKTGADSLRINTEEDYVKELLRFFKKRGR